MSYINLYFATILGTRIMTTLPEDFQLNDMLQLIRSKINETAVENSIFMCKGTRLSLNNPIVFQDQKQKLIRDGDVILIGNKITHCPWNQSHVESNKVKLSKKKNTKIILGILFAFYF